MLLGRDISRTSWGKQSLDCAISNAKHPDAALPRGFLADSQVALIKRAEVCQRSYDLTDTRAGHGVVFADDLSQVDGDGPGATLDGGQQVFQKPNQHAAHTALLDRSVASELGWGCRGERTNKDS